MNEQFKLSEGYAGHYWIGGYSDYPGGAYRWTSGSPFEFDDFVENPGTERYLHQRTIMLGIQKHQRMIEIMVVSVRARRLSGKRNQRWEDAVGKTNVLPIGYK